MNSILGILFVVMATILGKWLLFDDDTADDESGESPTLRIPATPPKQKPLSKSA